MGFIDECQCNVKGVLRSLTDRRLNPRGPAEHLIWTTFGWGLWGSCIAKEILAE